MEVNKRLQAILLEDENVSRLRYRLFRKFLECKSRRCFGRSEVLADSTRVRECADECAQLLRFQFEFGLGYAEELSVDFVRKVDECARVDEPDECFQREKQQFLKRDVETFREHYLDYLGNLVSRNQLS